MKRTICRGQRATTLVHASSTTFFSRLSLPVMGSASPKQPQSFTGSQKAIHTVTSVISIMKHSATREVRRRWMAKSSSKPRVNSIADRPTEADSVSQSGSRCPMCRAVA